MKIGIDIIEVERMRGLGEKMNRVFSADEMKYLESKNFAPETIAGMFSAKEAFFKALGTGVMHGKLRQVEILHHQSGQPFYRLGNDFEKNLSVSLSISHTSKTAVAVCVIY